MPIGMEFDGFVKIVTAGNEKPWMDDNGIMTVGILRFLTDDSILM